MQTAPPIVDRELQRLFSCSFAREFRRCVRAYMKRWRMRPSTLGLKALNDPGFVKELLRKGRRVRLTTADRARRYMGLLPLRALLVYEIRAFLRITGVKPWQVGEWAIHQPGFIDRLFEGSSPRLQTIDRLRHWMHRQLRPEQFNALLLAVARDLSGDEEVDGVFFYDGIEARTRSATDEESDEVVDDAQSRQAAFVEPAHAGALPGHGPGPPLPQDRALGALHAAGHRGVAQRVRSRQHVGPGTLTGVTLTGVTRSGAGSAKGRGPRAGPAQCVEAA